MCLYIDEYFHKHDESPHIAKKPILVFKNLLVVDSEEGLYETPFQGMTIEFNDGVYNYQPIEHVMAQDDSPKISTPHYGHLPRYVNIGFHAYQMRTIAERNCRDGHKVCWAVIPEGSEYFIGIGGEIVSNNLIVFETEKKFNEYKSSLGNEVVSLV